jgi:hypothetical protein
MLLTGVSTALYSVTIFLGQLGLNAAWRDRYPETASRPISWVELAIAAVGMLVWASFLLPAE